MGVNLSLLASIGGPDWDDPVEVARLLQPRSRFELGVACDLVNAGWPPAGELFIGRLGDVTLISARELMLFNPSKLARRFLQLRSEATFLFSQQSARDMFAYGVWSQAALVRSLSVNPVGGVWENLGERLPFEEQFWQGNRPAGPGYPLPFHPLEFGEAALATLLDLGFEGRPRATSADQVSMQRLTKT